MPELVAKQLALIEAEDAEEEEEGEGDADGERVDLVTGEVTTEPVIRPWDLPALGDGEFADAVFGWLDDVVMWLNHSYGWQEEQVIPACWQQHQGLSCDLAAIAFARSDAYAPPTAGYAGRWHSDLEDFYRRMITALGDAGRDCRRGDHKRPSGYALKSVQTAITGRT
ncbi:hypothetical protein [Kitasatospora sp. NBC_01302]|uniref:hypothetical protein n=1 Tax=Kitasatospora sp. NBC_01302 TaxID=2903575 RepID=UPI002E12FD8E|nr:hypothetical protein OG294_40880 [Kitasatospora sp. NBC_01302]